MNVGYVDGFIPFEEWRKTVSDFKGFCAYCRERVYEERDHFIPQTKGGKTEVGNLLPACVPCNKRKSNLTGDALIGLFGQEKVEQLMSYLTSRSGVPVAFPVEVVRSNDSGIHLRVKELAQKQGFTQKDLAEKSDVSLQVVAKLWNNYSQRVELLALAKIARTLGASFDELIQVTE